ncbi:MAG TPA: hypothetical protein VGC29_06195, partial [Flavisolibacter sp.]
MKIFIFLLFALFFHFNEAQSQILKNVTNRAKQKVENKAGDKVEKAIDEAVDGKPKTKKEKDSEDDGEDDEENNGDAKPSAATAKSEGLKSYSKYDFIQGEKVIAFEDFSNANVGDFPTRWNTDGSAEVVTLN